MRKRLKAKKLPDLTLVLVILSILLFGVIMVYDSSVVYASDLFGGKYYFLILQSFWVGVALMVGMIASLVDYHLLSRLTKFLLLASLAFLIILALPRILPSVFLPFYEVFVPKINGAYRWFYLNPRPLPPIPILGRIGFQPSEFAKIAISLYLASLLSYQKKRGVLLNLMIMAGLFGGLVVAQPDFGTATIIVGVALLIYYVSGAPMRNLVLVSILILVLGLIFVGSSP